MNKPDWDTWRHIPLVKRWEAAALSLDIDPDPLRRLNRSECDPKTIAGKVAREEFEKRRRIIESQRYSTLPGCRNTRRIGIKPFAAWARRIGWDIPPELAALADSAELDPQAELEKAKAQLKAVSDERDSLRETVDRLTVDNAEPDPRHRKTLLRIIGALLDLAEIEPNEPPKTTAHEVNAKLELQGGGMKPDTIAEVIRAARQLLANE